MLVLEFLGYSTIYVAISFTSALLVCLLGISFYRWLTPIDEFKEIRENNLGVAIITATIIIILAMMSKDGIVLLIESLIPYPVLPPA